MNEMRAMSGAETWLRRVASIGSVLEAEAPEADRLRELTGKAIAALHGERMLRLLLPGDVGGFELPLPEFFEIVEAVAGFDGSAAWCVCQGNACAMLAGYLDARLAAEIWAGDSTALLAWGPGRAEARAVAGGYRVNANTFFASGSHHATWLAAHCLVVEADGTPRRDSAGVQENRSMLIPAAEATLSDSWNVVGLRGTGSDGFVIENLFVPEKRSIVRARMIEDRPPRSRLHALPLMTVYASGFAGVALGIARGFLDRFLDLALTKKPRGIAEALKDSPVVQNEAARAEARLSAARAFLVDEIGRSWRELERDGRASIETRMRIRLAGTHSIHEAKAVVDMLYDTAGSSAVLADGPFERRFRDIHAVALQIQGRKRHYQTYGGWMMGREVNATDMTAI